jgi:hypothetical protein
MTMTSSPHINTARPSRTRGLWAAALFVVLAGLFGMHGLAEHGMATMASGPGTADVAGMAADVAGMVDLGAPGATAKTAGEGAVAHAAGMAHQAVTAAASSAVRVADLPVVAAATMTDAGQAAATAIPGSAGLGHQAMSMTGLCLAMLSVGLLALLALLVRRTPRGLLLRAAATPVVSYVCRERDPNPPSLTLLSILRC